MSQSRRENSRIFVAAWEYPPVMSGESVICSRTLKYSRFHYDICCGPAGCGEGGHTRVFPVGGNKYLRWPFAAARQFTALNKKMRYPVMMSRVMPPNGHLAGWLIKKLHPHIKWIAYFSDPIWNSPFLGTPFHHDDSHRPNWLLMKIFGFPCKWALDQADVLLFNNERLAKYVLGSRYARYGSKVVIAPYGHEGVRARENPRRGNGKFRLTHVGQIYGDRTLTELIAGLEQLKNESPGLFHRLEVHLVGFVCKAEQVRIAQSSVRKAFVANGQVPYSESIQAMYEADCLLVIDPVFDSPQKNIYVPGKIYDYMSTGKPIMCICDEDSATADLAHAAGCMIVPQSGDNVCRAVQSVLQKQPTADLRRYDGFCLARQESKLDQAIERLLE